MRHLRHLLRAAKHLAKSSALPRWTKWLLAAGLLPIPGPIDELALIIALVILAVRHRTLVRQAWHTTQESPHKTP